MSGKANIANCRIQLQRRDEILVRFRVQTPFQLKRKKSRLVVAGEDGKCQQALYSIDSKKSTFQLFDTFF